MTRTTLVLALFALAAPASAAPIELAIQNRSSQAVQSLHAYPVIAGVLSQQTLIGNLTQDVAPGKSYRLKLNSDQCGVIHVYIGMADQSTIDATLDTCRRRDLHVVD